MEKNSMLHSYARSSSRGPGKPSGPVNMPFAGGQKKGPHPADKDPAHFASSFLAERGCLSQGKVHEHTAA